MRKKWLSLFMVITMLVTMFIPTAAFAGTEADNDTITIETTLQDGLQQKASRRTIDVIAKVDGKKVSSKVLLNGKSVNRAWSDATKDSYTLRFEDEGENTVTIQAVKDEQVLKEITRTVNYTKAEKGEAIGHATVSLEGLTIGVGYFIEPVEVEIHEGENAAQVLARVLTENGYSFDHTGRIEDSFYLSMIANGGEYKKGCQEKNDIMKQVPVDITGKVPACLQNVLDEKNVKPDKIDYLNDKGEVIELGEFYYTYMSGWMYSINNVFPNVGFSDSYLGDGDVMRVQFTLYGYGADIGGGYSMGGGDTTDFYKVADKSMLLRSLSSFNAKENKDELLTDAGVKAAYDEAYALGVQLDATQEDVDAAVAKLNEALADYDKMVEDKAAAKKVDDMIDSIGEITLDSLDAINAAKEAYEALTDDQKAYVEGLEKLQAAMDKYDALKKAADKKNDTNKDNNKDKTDANKTPKTGDESTVILYMLVMTTAAGAAFTAKKRQSK